MINYAILNRMNSLYIPVILDLKDDRDFDSYIKIIDAGNVILYDSIKSQIKELVLIRNPLMQSDSTELTQMVEQIVGTDSKLYGNWVYYPWDNRLIHILPESEFIEVRTNRNRNKITKDEQLLLGSKRVGIAGLSVGRSVALTIATERIAGEIILADFDTLDLSNLNRLKAGLYDLGMNKCISTAREIAYLDPYIKVKCYTDGLNSNNMLDFFTKQNKLDLFIEECDDLVVKIESRIMARNLGIPVVMEASDRCLVDIERYDLDPDRPLLHGIIDEDDIKNVGSLKTFEDKLKLMSKIVDVNQISDRMRNSLPEIGKSLRTWPQLSSDVTFGAGVVAMICRSLLLGEQIVSGRFYFADLMNVQNKIS